jgi:hypothetical protein
MSDLGSAMDVQVLNLNETLMPDGAVKERQPKLNIHENKCATLPGNQGGHPDA